MLLILVIMITTMLILVTNLVVNNRNIIISMKTGRARLRLRSLPARSPWPPGSEGPCALTRRRASVCFFSRAHREADPNTSINKQVHISSRWPPFKDQGETIPCLAASSGHKVSLISGGIACLTLLVQRIFSSNATNNVANYGPPRHHETNIEQTRPH